jgi:signal transduction histidine kinase
VPRPPRRLHLYWLLLLAPTLAVGAVTVALLWREQARLERDATAVRDTRLAAVVARARLVAENADLLVADVRDTLTAPMRELTTAGWSTLLPGWALQNSLVLGGFTLSPYGQLTQPDPTGDEGRAFRKKFTRLLDDIRPWRDIAVTQNYASSPAQSGQVRGSLQTGLTQQSGQNSGNSYAANSNAIQFNQQRKDLQNLSQGGTLARQVTAVERGGWVPLGGGSELAPLRVIVWFQANPGADVRGAEINLGTLAARLAATLPADIEVGEGYAMLDDTGRTLGARGTTPAGTEPVARVPLDAVLLSGWQVAAFLPVAGPAAAGRSLFVMGIVLTGLFVLAILASGSLLLRQAEASATEARQKTSFVANVSHELKTPLTTIRLYAELLEQGRVRDDAQRAGFLRTIGAETQRLARLVNNVLDFSKLEQGKKLYARVPLDLGAELEALLDTHGPRIAEAGLRLESRFPVTPLLLTTDRDAFAQVVLNLVENACKYAAVGGEVSVTLAGGAGIGAAVRVLDRGPGVPETQREKIFDQFHRVDTALTAEKTGAGLGLSIARQLARGLGGDLRHEPRDGGGAIFIFELP